MAARHWLLATYLVSLRAALAMLVLRPDLTARVHDRIWPTRQPRSRRRSARPPL